MAHHPFVPGVRFNDCVFTEPVRLQQWVQPQSAGIAAILARDSRWAPKPFQPLFFAEFGNAASRVFDGSAHDVYVAVLPMPFSTSAQRKALRNELISAYNPLCQTGNLPSASELAHRVDELETRQREQNAQLMTMLSHLCRLLEPQPVEPRRRIGFLPAEAY
jgi:hypothetical protein